MARSELPTLHLLKAERLSATVDAVRSSLTPAALAALSHVCLTTAHDAELLARVENALAALGPPGQAVAYNPEDNAGLPDERYEEHGQFSVCCESMGIQSRLSFAHSSGRAVRTCGTRCQSRRGSSPSIDIS